MGVVILLVCTAGLMSGLTIGLMSLDLTNLEILIKGGQPKEQKYATRLINLVRQHHLLLVTLLLGNAAAMEALPIFLEMLVSPVLAVIFSVTLVLMFGEVIPQAICTRWGLAVGYYTYWIVWVIIVICFPIAWPISKILDWVIGTDHGTFFRRAELKELVTIHQAPGNNTEKENNHGNNPLETGEALTKEEVTIIRGALDLRNKKVFDCYVALDDVFMLDSLSLFNRQTLEKIVEVGHSRIPIYRGKREHIVGMLFVKRILLCTLDEAISIDKLPITRLPTVSSSLPLYNMLNIFQTGKSHMALILDDKDGLTPLGIITLEDIIQELLQYETNVEFDFQISQQTDLKRVSPAKTVVKNIKGKKDKTEKKQIRRRNLWN